MILETKSGSTRLHSVENSLWKRLWTCRKTDYVMNGELLQRNIWVDHLQGGRMFLYPVDGSCSFLQISNKFCHNPRYYISEANKLYCHLRENFKAQYFAYFNSKFFLDFGC